MAECTVVPESGCIPIDADVPLDRACLIGCGVMKLDELVTRRFTLGEVREAFTALEQGEVARGVITF